MKCWINNEVVEAADARISPFDRGFLLGDGVYETIQFFSGVGVGMDLHVERLARSMKETGIAGFDPATMDEISETLLKTNELRNALVYIQVTRGVQIPRRHLPAADLAPTVFAVASPAPSLAEYTQPGEARCISRIDDRWLRCSIKATSLLANVLGQIECNAHDCNEAILHRDGFVTEGTMTNVLVVQDNTIITPVIGGLPSILAGVTRHLILECARDLGFETHEGEITIDELRSAEEVMITSSRRLIDGVVEVDSGPIGNGTVGPWTHRLFDHLRKRIAADCGVLSGSASN